MIKSIINILNDKNIIESSDSSHYNCYFNNRANINLFLYSKKEKKPLLFMKISNLRDFEKIFINMKKVYRVLPDIVPEPVCMFNLGQYQVLATKVYNFELLISMPVYDKNKRGALLKNVLSRITQLQMNTKQDHITFDEEFYRNNIVSKMHDFIEKWRDDELKNDLKQHMEGLNKYYGTRIPRIPQHGDLVVYNTGIIGGDIEKIILIDWDSYADIELPMYDPLIFLLTFLDFYGESLYERAEHTDHVYGAFSGYCDSIGLDRDLAIDFYPVCLLLFAGTKVDIGVHGGQEFAYKELKKFFAKRDQIVLRRQ